MRPQLLKHVIADATWPSGDGNRVLDHQLVDFGQLGTALDGWKLLDRRAGEAFDLKRVRVVRDAIFAGIELGGDHDGKLNITTRDILLRFELEQKAHDVAHRRRYMGEHGDLVAKWA